MTYALDRMGIGFEPFLADFGQKLKSLAASVLLTLGVVYKQHIYEFSL